MNSHLITVVVPVYNVQDYLQECLDSIARQTCGNLEILCIDDCSTDDSLAIARRYAEKDSRFTVLRHEVNRGLGETRNTGLSRAKGKYIAFVDSDDVLVRDALEKQYVPIERYGLDIVWMKLARFTQSGGARVIDTPLGPLGEDQFIESSRFGNYPCSACTKLFRTSFLRENAIGFPAGLFEDVEFYFKSHCHTTRVYLVNECLYLYRQRDDSIIGQLFQGKSRCRDAVAACANCHRYLVEKNLFDDKRQFLLDIIPERLDSFIYSRHYKEEILALAKEMLRDIGFPEGYDTDEEFMLMAIACNRYRPSLEKWYAPLTVLNRLNPFPRSRRKWRAWIQVNCLVR